MKCESTFSHKVAAQTEIVSGPSHFGQHVGFLPARKEKKSADFGPTKLSAQAIVGLEFQPRFEISQIFTLQNTWVGERKFAICLSSSTSSNGAVFLGYGPYVLLPGIDVSKSLVYTPLLLIPFSTAPGYVADPSAEYFINVNTVNPYTVLENTIYNAFVDAFVKEFPAHVPRVAAVEPFGACFNSTHIRKTRVGPVVPNVDFVLQSESVYWRVLATNSMVQVSKDVLCLGFVDAGLRPSNPRTAIVIGGHQLEENFLQFDLAASRLGFSSLLSSGQTTCANFNFTSNA
ncbi:hypothetical protein CerSpe_015830 [Prunus speciosa]